MKWHGSQHQSYIKIVDIKKCDGTYNLEDAGNYKTILGLECRGLEPYGWVPSDDFIAYSHPHGTAFINVDLSEKDWCDFDDDNEMPVSVMNLDYMLEKA